MGIKALITVLTARKWILIQAVFAGAIAALFAGMVLPEEYRSTARVQVDSLQQNLLTGNFEPRVRVSEFLGQQAAIAGSRSVALQVYDVLVAQGQLIEADLEDEWREATGGELVAGNDVRLWAADELLKKVEIEANAGQSTLAINFKSEDPSQSARIANAFANQYMQSVLDRRQRRAARNAANFSGETASLEDNIEQAQRDLTDFRQKSGIVGLGAQRLENSEVELAAVTMRLAEARADLSEAQSLLRQAREATGRELLTLPLSQDIPSGRQAQSRLGSVLVQLQRLSERYGPSYPSLIEADNERRSLERTILKSVEDRAEFATRRVAALEENLQLKKIEVVALQETKQSYDVLSKRVDASRETYDLVATRSLQETLQSRVGVVDVLMLARAVPAESPVTPHIAIIVLVGAVIGMVLGASTAVVMELHEGRIRSPETVSKLLKAPVIADISLPARAQRERRAA